MSDLDKLIAAVEAGTCPDFCSAFSWEWHSIGLCVEATSAFSGSLDAALRLHEALLPANAYRQAMKRHHGEFGREQ